MATTPTGDASVPKTVPESAWASVRVEVESLLPLPMDTTCGKIEVSLVNDSPVTLRCDGDEPLGLHCQLLDCNGNLVAGGPLESPLEATLAPGTTHSKALEFRIPAAMNDRVASLRVVLGREDGPRVEKLHRNHAGTVVLDRGEHLSRLHDVMLQGARIWPLGRSNGLRWPSNAMMVSQRHKLLYIPVAKCACTSLKSAMLELAGIEQADKVVELGVHLVTDRFNTGAQLKDLPMKQAWEILASRDYFKFMVIREPFERLVSAYLEKFVYHRHDERNLLHTREVIAIAQGTNEIDIHRGISFEEFLSVLLGCDEAQLDPHWRPQSLYRRTVKHRINTYRLENIDRLEEALKDITGHPVRLAHRNKTARSSALVPGVSRLPAAEVEKLGSFDPRSFASSSLRGDIERYYEQDLELYRSAL